MFALPPEDRSLSPRTGWTRAHWEAVADGLLAALDPYWSEDRAEIRLPGRPSSSRCDGLEGFARTFLLAALRVAGGGPPGLLTRHRAGLAHGPRVWQPVTDRAQPMVEAASIAVGLWLTRDRLWETLDPRTRAEVTDWLAAALRHQPADNNWWLFPAMVGGFLGDESAVRRGLDRIERWHLGDGWYSDGANRSFDHYNGWAMHLYPALLHLLSATAPGVYGERLRAYLTGYALMFDHDGGMMYHGRSLTYRFASVAPLFAGALTGHTPLTPGQTRGIASAVLRRFLDHGALSADGLLTLGWHGPHEPSLQSYSGPASPYWASKAFIGLLLPPEHPVWTATEEAGPTGPAALPAPGLVVQHTGGVARLLNHGSQHAVGDPLYDRYAYSTGTGPTTETPDNHFGRVNADGSVPPRGLITPRGAGQDGDLAWAASADGHGTSSLSVVNGAVELRVHRVPDGAAVRQSGWAVTGPAATERSGARVSLHPATGPASHLIGLYGYATAAVTEERAGTAFGAPALIPLLDGVAADGWAISAAILGAEPGALPTVAPGPGDNLTVTWPDGVTCAYTVAAPGRPA